MTGSVLQHVFHKSVLREYDVRGIVGETLTIEDAYFLGRSFGSVLISRGGCSVSVGRDGRLSSPELSENLIKGLLDCGVTVYRIGVCPTPMLYYSVYDLGLDAGIMVTGSHNPSNYNGFKMVMNKKPFWGDDIRNLGKVSENGIFAVGSGHFHDVNVSDAYVERLIRDISFKHPLSIAWDPGNGSAGEILQPLIKHIPGRSFVINSEIDGNFPAHHPDPTEEKNLEQLKILVSEHNCDLGIAFDGDGDRIGVVDKKGRVLWGDQLMCLYSKDVLSRHPSASIIADVKASQVLFDEIRRLGGNPIMEKTGHSIIKTRMATTGALLAGEMSGHIFFADDWYGFDDALYAAVRLIAILSNSEATLEQIKDSLPHTFSTPEVRITCSDEHKFEIVSSIKEKVSNSGKCFIDIDGVRVIDEDGWWLLRASNTQNVLVLRVEAISEDSFERLKKEVKEVLSASGVEYGDEF